MVSYLFKILILTVFSFIIIYFYYFTNPAHIENFDGYLIYIFLMIIIYSIYKIIHLLSNKKIIEFSALKILMFFLIHLFILSILFFFFSGKEIIFIISLMSGVELFFKILLFSILPIIIVIILLSFGRKIISYFSFLKEETDTYKFILSLLLGFFSFIFILDIIGMIGFYNLYIVFGILALFIAFGYKELIKTFNYIDTYKIKVDIQEGNYLKLLSTEFLFIISTLVLSVSLISIVRPFPIGWDDLGVYMNYPHLMAEAGSIISLGGMYAWQTFTGIGYMFGNPTQAFFLNVVGGFLSFILLILITSDLLKTTSSSKIKTFINIPLLVGTMFIAMPMIVFQQAKDMKLDAGLFFVSIVSIYLLYKYYLKFSEKSYSLLKSEKIISKIKNINLLSDSKNKVQKKYYIIMFIIGLLAGFAFSIKFTSLLLISAIIGVIAFARLGIIGFLGYLAIFFAIFTKAGLWSMMNVVVNPNGIVGFENTFFIISGIIGILLISISFYLNIKNIKKFIIEFFIFLLGIFIALSPWISKNIINSYPDISVGSIISGKTDRFVIDYTKIYTEEELKIKEEKAKELSRIGETGTSSNEDFGRYLGYEEGINNYIKFPWNLTMQINQGGEFTDIGFLLLALLPVLLLFLPFRRKYYPYLIVLVLILELLIFIKTDNKLIEKTNILGFTKTSQEQLFNSNNQVFKDKYFNKDIYDIKLNNYISNKDILSLVTPDNNFVALKQYISSSFYEDIKYKVLNEDSGKEIAFLKVSLSDDDFKKLKELRKLYSKYISFNPNIDSIVTLEKNIKKLKIEEGEKIIDLWKNNKTINQYFTDLFSKFNLPYGYIIILLIFLLPTLFLIYSISSKKEEEKSKIKLFKLNLIFACFYTFLWTISAFGIVWYGIAMYFSFLLTIAIATYYLTNYSDKDSEKVYFSKMFGSMVFCLIILIYIVNSIIPHSFNNLKSAGYKEYKTGDITIINAPYLYNREYLKILFYINISEDKKIDFLNEFITEDVKKIKPGIVNMDIYDIKSILIQIITQIKTKEAESKNPLDKDIKKILISAEKSLNDIFKNISNPPKKYKNEVGIYRIGTFLKYYISENNKRLLEDSLIYSFNNYIYDSNINTTVENMKKLGLGFLLVDLNAATIDKDERRNLTKRYEKLLSTFTSEKLELIDTDSICLRVALEDFNKSNKFSEDRENFLEIAGVNYESYTKDGTQINRGVKLTKCYNRIIEIIKNEEINENNYNYLININNYLIKNQELFKNQKDLSNFLRKEIRHGYKVLFKIK